METFTISQVMFMLDIMREDKARWCKFGDDTDVISEYDEIIRKLKDRLDEYHSGRRAIEILTTLKH